jgi:long-chain acyl-CoA synthetase
MMRDYRNVHEMLVETVRRRPDAPAYQTIRDDRSLSTVTWQAFYDDVRRAAKGLIALGVGPGDAVAILSFTRYEWLVTDFATAAIGARTIGIYQSLPAHECRYIIDHSDAVVILAENPEQLDKLLAVRAEIPAVRQVVLCEPDGAPDGDGWTMAWEDFLAAGEGVADADLTARIEAVGPGDVAAVVYTSGTTGVPKGAMITHDNFTFTAQSALACLPVEEDDIQLLFLPMAHVFARICIAFALKAGCATALGRSIEAVPEDLKIARPHWFASVPRLYEKVHTRVISGAETKGGVALALFRWALRVGMEVSEHLQAHRPVPLLTRLQYALASKLVFSKVHAALGGRLRFCVSGAAPLNADVARFFHAAGVLILEGIGMTENTSFTNVNRLNDYRFGTVGPPGPGIEQATAADGEVLYRGRNVMKGYHKMPAETAEAIDPDGWLHTGDLGEVEDRGFLRITGRKKDLIITAGGKNVAPSALEGRLATSKYIAQACVVGDRRRYLAALVTLDPANVEEYARAQGIAFASFAELQRHPRVQALVEAEVEERNRELASFETIKRVAVVAEFTIDNGLLTPTMKVKRNLVTQRYADRIEGLYQEA